ncbi:hypothetical protein BKA60DRAFT_582163 [Fusarium oxysporum]|nr:hypothetical protein BKA60DRAFT_582163 [Fusarium oxysporum]
MSGVARLAKNLHVLYERGHWHRAYEPIVFIPLQLSNLRQFGEHPMRCRNSFIVLKPQPEIHGSLILYIPFHLHHMRPDLRYKHPLAQDQTSD